MVISCIMSFISGFSYPFLTAVMLAPFSQNLGAVSSAYGFLSQGLSGIFLFFISFIKVSSMVEIVVCYFLISVLCVIFNKLIYLK
jgi:hypothetical protein